MRPVQYSNFLAQEALSFAETCTFSPNQVPNDMNLVLVADPLLLKSSPPILDYFNDKKYFRPEWNNCTADISINNCQTFKNLIHDNLQFMGCGGAICSPHSDDEKDQYWHFFSCKFSETADGFPYRIRNHSAIDSGESLCPIIESVESYESRFKTDHFSNAVIIIIAIALFAKLIFIIRLIVKKISTYYNEKDPEVKTTMVSDEHVKMRK